MLKINFYPESDHSDFVKAAKEYQKIWDEDGQRIVSKIEEITGLKFKQNEINALVFEGISQTYPMLYRASLDDWLKKEHIVHELCHKIINSNTPGSRELMRTNRQVWDLKKHKQLDLVLYDVLVELYGEDFAKNAVENESNRPGRDFYKDAWDYALNFDKETRQQEFRKSIKEPIESQFE